MKYILVAIILVVYPKTDIEYLASIINAECGICDETEMYLTGSTVLNRVQHKKYPNSIKKVIFQKNQYYAITSAGFHPTEKTTKIAKDLINGVGRDYDVIFMYREELSTDTNFINRIKDRVIYNMQYHKFAK